MSTTRLRSLWLQLPSIAKRLREASTLALASDFDGTLSPIVPHPDDAVLPERTHQAIRRLANLDRVRLAFLSGRTIDDLQPRIGLQGVFLAGAAGLEIQRESGARESVPPGSEVPRELRDELEAWAERFPNAWLEDKKYSLALHYRHVAPNKQGAFDAGVRRRFRRFEGRAHLVHGKKVFEFMPPVPQDKAWALDQWMSQLPQDALPMYLGDDTNDEPALQLMRKRGGISVAVGRPASRAEFGIDSPTGVMWFFEWLDREWTDVLDVLRPASSVAGSVAEEGLL